MGIFDRNIAPRPEEGSENDQIPGRGLAFLTRPAVPYHLMKKGVQNPYSPYSRAYDYRYGIFSGGGVKRGTRSAQSVTLQGLHSW